MHPLNSLVKPQELFMSLKEACEVLEVDRNNLSSMLGRKQIEFELVAGHRLLYRQSVYALKERRDNKNKVHNPWAKQEVSNVSP